ncbi:MAG: 16S rRNA (adenine(1518)-N(6)/adenine(1519)-N(6))-dimethyltransferase RsmA [Polyangiaceae bacterium]|nr:16S rRNA (adenine(1518)-N(6)/adenine(1519)-N(6))-dimethyltransferase RsmA [Polyangiaceae bacterium]
MGRKLFVERGLRAKKSFGQCFLADKNIAKRMARECVLEPGSSVLEIGAGTGALTGPLLDLNAKVVAVERDRDMIPILNASFSTNVESGQLSIHEADAAACDWSAILDRMPRPRAAVGNLPYQITGRLLERATCAAAKVDRIVFMVQKEVADRIAAPPGTREYGALSVFMQRSFHIVRRFPVPPQCFRPQPSVHSTVIVMEPNKPPVEPASNEFRKFVLGSFSARRKTIRNAWGGFLPSSLSNDHEELLSEIAADLGIQLDFRPEQLSPDQFERAWMQICR